MQPGRVRTLKNIYGRIIRFYPARIKSEFSEEMVEVFGERLNQADKGNTWLGIKYFVHEVFDLPGIVFRNAGHKEEGLMLQETENENSNPGERRTQPYQVRPAFAWQVILGLLPLLIAPLIGIITAVSGSGMDGLTPDMMRSNSGIILAGILIIMAFLVYSWKAGFPVWTFPYWGLLIPWTLFMTVLSTPGLNLFTIPLFGEQMWGIRAWIPLLIVTAFGIAITRSFAPFKQLIKNISFDWTIISFALYTPLPLFLWVTYDEMHGEGLFLAGMHLILGAGALAYLISKTIRARFISLLAGLVLSWFPSGVYIWHYWDGRYIPGLDGRITGPGNLVGMTAAMFFLAFILCIPWVVARLIHLGRKLQQGPPTVTAG